MRYHVAKTTKGLIEYRLEGSGPVVVVLNGGLCSRDSRLSHERLAACGFSVLTPSRPGYDATPSSVGRTAQEASDALAALLSVLRVPRASIIGISAAGPTALAFAQQYPDATDKLVLESALTLPWNDLAKHRWRVLCGGAEQLIAWGSKLVLRLFPRTVIRATMRPLTTLDVDEVLSRMSPSDLEFVSRMIVASRSGRGFLNDLEHRVDDLAAIRSPVLVIYSPHDKVVRPKNAERVMQEVKGAELYEVPADSHLIWIGRYADQVWTKRLTFLRAGGRSSEISVGSRSGERGASTPCFPQPTGG